MVCTRGERIRKAIEAMRALDAVGQMVVIQQLQMDLTLLEVDPAQPTTREPRVVIAAPTTEAHHQLAAAAPSLRLVQGGGRTPPDNWADVPGSWRADA